MGRLLPPDVLPRSATGERTAVRLGEKMTTVAAEAEWIESLAPDLAIRFLARLS